METYMIIYCNTAKLQPAQQVNKLGKYLYDHLDGAYSFKRSGNTFDVYTVLLYQLPEDKRIPELGEEFNDVHEMHINLNLTTYQNKVRLDVIEITPDARTLGCHVYPPERLTDLEAAKQRLLRDTARDLSKAYQDYNFLF